MQLGHHYATPKNNQSKEVEFGMLLVLKLCIIETTPSPLGFNIDYDC